MAVPGRSGRDVRGSAVETDTAQGELAAALASAAVTLDATSTTSIYHHNPMEPHATIAIWTDEGSPSTSPHPISLLKVASAAL